MEDFFKHQRITQGNRPPLDWNSLTLGGLWKCLCPAPGCGAYCKSSSCAFTGNQNWRHIMTSWSWLLLGSSSGPWVEVKPTGFCLHQIHLHGFSHWEDSASCTETLPMFTWKWIAVLIILHDPLLMGVLIWMTRKFSSKSEVVREKIKWKGRSLRVINSVCSFHSFCAF